jgi:hypothetical protein
MKDFESVFIVVALLWTAFITYAVYLHVKLRRLEEGGK